MSSKQYAEYIANLVINKYLEIFADIVVINEHLLDKLYIIFLSFVDNDELERLALDSSEPLDIQKRQFFYHYYLPYILNTTKIYRTQGKIPIEDCYKNIEYIDIESRCYYFYEQINDLTDLKYTLIQWVTKK